METYQYNPDGALTEWESFHADPDGKSYISGFGNVTTSERIFYFYQADGTLMYRGESTYDSDGNQMTLDYYYYNSDGTLVKIVEIRYDKNGNEISNVTRNMDD